MSRILQHIIDSNAMGASNSGTQKPEKPRDDGGGDMQNGTSPTRKNHHKSTSNDMKSQKKSIITRAELRNLSNKKKQCPEEDDSMSATVVQQKHDKPRTNSNGTSTYTETHRVKSQNTEVRPGASVFNNQTNKFVELSSTSALSGENHNCKPEETFLTTSLHDRNDNINVSCTTKSCDDPNNLSLNEMETSKKSELETKNNYMYQGARPKTSIPRQSVTKTKNVSKIHGKEPDFNHGIVDQNPDLFDPWRAAGAVLHDALKRDSPDHMRHLETHRGTDDPMNLMLEETQRDYVHDHSPLLLENETCIKSGTTNLTVKNETAAKMLQKVRDRKQGSNNIPSTSTFTPQNALELVRARKEGAKPEGVVDLRAERKVEVEGQAKSKCHEETIFTHQAKKSRKERNLLCAKYFNPKYTNDSATEFGVQEDTDDKISRAKHKKKKPKSHSLKPEPKTSELQDCAACKEFENVFQSGILPERNKTDTSDIILDMPVLVDASDSDDELSSSSLNLGDRKVIEIQKDKKNKTVPSVDLFGMPELVDASDSDDSFNFPLGKIAEKKKSKKLTHSSDSLPSLVSEHSSDSDGLTEDVMDEKQGSKDENGYWGSLFFSPFKYDSASSASLVWSEDEDEERTKDVKADDEDDSPLAGVFYGIEGSDHESLPSLIDDQDPESDHNEKSDSSKSESENDADDEFECDCYACIHKRVFSQINWEEDEEEVLGAEGSTETEYHSEREPTVNTSRNAGVDTGVDDVYRNLDADADEYPPIFPFLQIPLFDPLELFNTHHSHPRRFERSFIEGIQNDLLEALYQNVILQMVAMHPDLLSEQAPPPAGKDIIKNLEKVLIGSALKDADQQCPICLNHFNPGETASSLPCSHIFHILCIEAWLNKSGTCPVCRHKLV